MKEYTFPSYPKMSDRTEQWHLDEKEWRQLSAMNWAVTEKIHGANFCFVATKEDIFCAKRKSILAPEDDFFGYKRVREKLIVKVQQLFNELRVDHETLDRLFIYGELFGGSYPHEDVPVVAGLEAVQTGIHYCPDLEFCVFDLAWDIEGNFSFFSFEKTIEVCQKHELFHAVPLFCGTFQECLDYEIGFDSTVPQALGLPPLPIANTAEGVVIRPLSNVLVKTSKGLRRPLLKRKIPQFSEDARYKGSQKKERKNFVPAMDLLEWRMLELMTEQRLDNVLSKTGRLTEENLAEVTRELLEDIWEELSISEASALSSISNEERALLNSVLEDEAKELVLARKNG